MSRTTVSVAEAEKRLSELIGRVPFGGEQIVITKRGKPMAVLASAAEGSKRLAEAKGWLNDKDDFFEIIDRIVEDRDKHVPRVLEGQVME